MRHAVRSPGRLWFLLIPLLLLLPARPVAPAPLGTDGPGWNWQATPVRTTWKPPIGPLCFDSLQPHVVLVTEPDSGTVAYDWVTGARTVVNPRPLTLCGPHGWLFSGDLRRDGPAWRFSLRDPTGQAIAHMPTHVAQDGTLQVYVHRRADPGFWASADAGLTWQWREPTIAPGNGLNNLAVAGADARVLYVSAPWGIGFSSDAGVTWEQRAGPEPPSNDPRQTLSINIVPLAGRATPVDRLLKWLTHGYSGSNVYGESVYLSTNGAQTFQEVVPWAKTKAFLGLDVVQTADGLLQYREDYGLSVIRTLQRSRDEGHTWLPVALPPEAPNTPYATRSTLLRLAYTPALVLFHLSDYLAYSSDSGQTWQRLGDLVSLGLQEFYSSPDYPPTLLQIGADGTVYTLALPLTGTQLMAPALPTQAAASRFFPETGHPLASPFRAYWESQGSLAQFGYPIMDAFEQLSPEDGRVYTTQYFERAVFTYQPENAPPDDVLIRSLGTAAYRQRYGAMGAPDQHPSIDNLQVFPETGHSIGGRFRAYWESHGGLAQQGYPLSDEFVEQNPLDGQTYTVQYFERAVFEWHPEYAGTPAEVLLRHLGTGQARQLGEPPAAAP